MNREDIEKMEAGSRLNKLIATDIIGQLVAPEHSCGLSGFNPMVGDSCDACEWEKTHTATYGGEKYSTDILAAMEVQKEMDRKNYYVHMGILPSYSYATFVNAGNGKTCWMGKALPSELPLAICKAALLATLPE
jgi:hypothetical protein